MDQPKAAVGSPHAASSSAFFGRAHELAELEVALSATRDRRGSLCVLTGEPGIGKSRLAEELVRRAAVAAIPVAWGRGWPNGGAPVFWPWIQLLRSLLREPEVLAHVRDLAAATGAPDTADARSVEADDH